MKTVPTLAVVGAGASGLFAAITAKELLLHEEKQADVILYEANARVGKKILVTGNGRCNLTNRNISKNNYHGYLPLFEGIYPQFSNENLIMQLKTWGLMVREDFAGRIYPLSNAAQSVLDILRNEAERLNIKVVADTKIVGIKRQTNGFLLNGVYFAECVILATGGKAAPQEGSDGSGYLLLKQLGQPVTPVYPALTGLRCLHFTKALKGIRAEGEITVKHKGRCLVKSKGEIQYTDYGLSGIPAMQVSGDIARLLTVEKCEKITVTVDSVPTLTEEALTEFLSAQTKRNPGLPMEMLLAGILPKRLGTFLLTELQLSPQIKAGLPNRSVIEKLSHEIKNKKYDVTAVNDFSQAQVTAGGADGADINTQTLESKIIKGLYITGELTDINGDCGGYNLQWAFSSGYVAGKNAARELINRVTD